jgi:hypothetical protein
MGTVDRETRRDLSGKREGRRSSPATASLAKIWQMIACGNVLVLAGGRRRMSSGAAVRAEKAAAVCGE